MLLNTSHGNLAAGIIAHRSRTCTDCCPLDLCCSPECDTFLQPNDLWPGLSWCCVVNMLFINVSSPSSLLSLLHLCCFLLPLALCALTISKTLSCCRHMALAPSHWPSPSCKKPTWLLVRAIRREFGRQHSSSRTNGSHRGCTVATVGLESWNTTRDLQLMTLSRRFNLTKLAR